MAEKNNKEDLYFEEVIKKTKTGITIPKALRDDLFEEEKDYYFRLKVPLEKNKIILEIITEEQADKVSEKIKVQKAAGKKSPKKGKKGEKTPKEQVINWGDIFLYDFEAKEKVKPILESAFEKFAQKPINFDDAMGRIKYALVSYLKSSKSENSKLYYAIIRFLIRVIEMFDQPNLIGWVSDKVAPHIESKFLYELALLDLIEICLKMKKMEQTEIFVKQVLADIREYPISEIYNIMSSLNQLVKRLKKNKKLETQAIFTIVRDDLIEFEGKVTGTDYKIQLIELLEDLGFIEKAYNITDILLKDLPSESMRIDDVRAIKKRLASKPI